MDDLIDGYRRFRARAWPERRERFAALARRGQSPQALVVACSDSRVDPAMILDAGPGEIFVIRNVANLVPPYAPDGAAHATSAALEFAIRVLAVPDAIVMGHAMCGGIQALLQGLPDPSGDFLGPWIRVAEPARRRALARKPADIQAACEEEAVKLSLENLMTFPWVRERVENGKLRLTGAVFDIRSGLLTLLRPDGGFAPLE